MTAKARETRNARRWALFGALGVFVIMLALAAAWRWGPLEEFAESGAITRWLDDAEGRPWMPFLVAAVYVGASMVMFPNTVLCLAVILALGPLAGTAYAFGGSMVAAVVGHSMGRLGGRRIDKLRFPAVNRIRAQLRRGGFVQVLTLRLLPVAPFSATNLLAGAARVRLLPFAAATAIGISPYILAFGFFGRQARRLMSNPTPADAALTLAIAVAAVLLVWWARSRWKDD